MTRLVLLPDRWTPRGEWARRLAQDVPGLRVDVVEEAASLHDQAQALRGADAAYGSLTPPLLAGAEDLRWLQSPKSNPPLSFWFPELVESQVVVTGFRGVYDDAIATHIMALVLALARRLDVYAGQQARREYGPPREALHLPDATVLIVGLGSIGAEVARLAAAFGATVIGTDARRDRPPPGAQAVHPPQALDELLPTADVVVNLLPHTPATDGTFDAARFSLVRRGALYVSAGRGETTRTDALSAALHDGRVGAAALDVVDPEPVPPDSPLWDAPRLLITPHVAWSGPDLAERRYGVVRDNCRRFLHGAPLLAEIDKREQY